MLTLVSRLRLVRDRAASTFRTQLWPLPVVGVVVAVLLGVALPRLDARVDASLPPTVTGFLFGGGASAARSVLSAVAGSLITVTSLTFSLTVVTLQLASSQFSPRLLRTFTRDRFVHATLALFLGTFTYALTVLRTVRDSSETLAPFVPQVAVTVAFVLALASVLGLVLFLAHLAREIRVETLLRTVHRDASGTARHVLAERDPAAPREAIVLPRPALAAVPLLAGSSGFLLQVDEDVLLAAAVDADAVVLLECYPGSALVAGTPLGTGWPREAGRFDADTQERLQNRVAAALTCGFERTEDRDIEYGLRQLTDVAIKALSPGINDPTTAIYALGHISALLCELAARDLAPRLLRDEQGRLRVALARPDLADLLDVAISQPRRYGAADALVLSRLFRLLRELAWTVRDPDQRVAIARQLSRLRATAAAQEFDATERTHLADLAGLVEQALTGSWPVEDVP